MGNYQAIEALKSILGIGELLTNKIFFVDLLKNGFHFIEVKRNSSCMACGENSADLVETHDYAMGDSCEDE
jgi:molybdopterin/thiamine biosynthesis adenylyltransferase